MRFWRCLPITGTPRMKHLLLVFSKLELLFCIDQDLGNIVLESIQDSISSNATARYCGVLVGVDLYLW